MLQYFIHRRRVKRLRKKIITHLVNITIAWYKSNPELPNGTEEELDMWISAYMIDKFEVIKEDKVWWRFVDLENKCRRLK